MAWGGRKTIAFLCGAIWKALFKKPSKPAYDDGLAGTEDGNTASDLMEKWRATS
jgi:hypothetical protein